MSAQKALGWLDQVTDNGARRALQLSLDSARRACSVLANEQSMQNAGAVAREPPRPPIRTGYDPAYGYGSYADRMRLYREQLARFNKEQVATEDRDHARALQASDAGAAAVQQARQQLDSALAILSALPEPLRGAAASPAAARFRAGFAAEPMLRPVFVQGSAIVGGPVIVGGGE